jgi:hypothetical protein
VHDGARTFAARYLQADASQVFAAIEEDDLNPPSTLTQREREIVGLLTWTSRRRRSPRTWGWAATRWSAP